MDKILSNLGEGEAALVLSLDKLDQIKKQAAERLEDLGICPGEQIKCVMLSPLGSLKAYLVKGSVIALRESTASLVTVSPVCKNETVQDLLKIPQTHENGAASNKTAGERI